MDAEFPHTLEEIPLNNKKDRIETIKKYNGRLVFVKDQHIKPFYISGRLEFDEENVLCYFLKTKDSKKTLHYHDLEVLLVPFS